MGAVSLIDYCDFEALEFKTVDALKLNIKPYYLDAKVADSMLCPLAFCASSSRGELVDTQNAFNEDISFLKYIDYKIDTIKRKKHKNIYCWFHNLSYDFRIIVHELFYRGFKQIVDSEQIEYEGVFLTEKHNSFALVGDSLSSFIGVNLYYKDFCIRLRDTMGIFNSSQDAILKSMGMPLKPEILWENINAKNVKLNMTEIINRCQYDVTSLATAIEKFKKTFSDNFNGEGSTAAGMSMDALKYYLCKSNSISDITSASKKEVFRSYYPKLSGTIKLISDGVYHGGICTVNPQYAGKLLFNLQMLDINSSYPASMTKPMPYGPGKFLSGFVEHGYSEYIVYISFEHIGTSFQRCHTENKARHILNMDMVEKENTFTRSQFPQEFNGFLCINSIDLETLKRHARIKELKFFKGVNYQVNTLVADYIKPIYEDRKKAKGEMKIAIKLLLNALYGKFAQDLSGIVRIHDSLTEAHNIIATDNNTLYKPFASAVTAYSRQNLINVMKELKNDFVYCDTDSVYFIKPEINILKLINLGYVHDDNLGYWSLDSDYGETIKKGKFLSKKNYLLKLGEGYNDDKYPDGKKVTCVGLSKKYHNQINFENFILNSETFKIRKMVNIYGGKAMRNTMFKIKERSVL